jgi:hypothetical protein
MARNARLSTKQSFRYFLPRNKRVTGKPTLTFAVDEKLLDRINEFRFGNRIETKSEAVRMLVEKGLRILKKHR